MPDAQLQAWAAASTVLYAADSGADRLVRLGFSPTVVGDLDSVDPASLVGLRTVQDADADRTDCEKMLSLIWAEGHRAVTVAGLEGDLLDHVLASLSSLASTPLIARIALRTGIGHVMRSGVSVRVADGFGRRVSLIPLMRSTGVTLRGVLWEVEEAVMEPAGFLSVSNEGTGEVFAAVRTGAVLLFVGREPSEPLDW